MQHPQTEEIELRSPVHLAFETFQARDLPLDLPVTFHSRYSGSHGRVIASDP